MDFEKILCVARKNELNKKEPVKCLQTKFKPPTKEQHEKDRLLSEGVQRFLARKEEEEQRKQKEAERRKLELMALRAKDPKANKRIQTMLKRTKSANKSVMEDAVDNNNTADTLAGPSQPDEDDYGFVSETSSQLYNKLIQKMYSTPSNDVPKFSPSKKPSSGNLSNTKERVKMALLKQEEEERLPHKRKKRSKGKNEDGDDEDSPTIDSFREKDRLGIEEQISKEKPKLKRAMPPPVDFHELLKIAEQKQHEPIVIEPKIKKPQEPEILMTKKQKLEHEKMQEWKRQRELRLQNLKNGTVEKKSLPKINKMSHSSAETNKVFTQKKLTENEKLNRKDLKTPNRNSETAFSKSNKEIPEKSSELKSSSGKKILNSSSEKKNSLMREIDSETSRLMKERDDALKLLKEKEKLIKERDEAVRLLKEKEQLIKQRDEVVKKLKLLEQSDKLRLLTSAKSSALPKKTGKSTNNAKSNPSKTEAGNVRQKSDSSLKVSNPPPKATDKSMARKNTTEVSLREFPPKDLKPLSKYGNGTSSNIQRKKQFPPAEVRRKAMALKRRRIESDDEYDSDLDDFIDDGANDIESEEVSKVISEIFRYDKNKYSKYDDLDDECMESNYAQISKEEYFSTKCGILEDLQDIQREKAKMAKKQKR